MYNKIFTKILDSSIWLEPMPTRIVWLTFIAAMDENGFVAFASPANVAQRAVVPLPETIEALKVLESPDANSSDPENEGRRLERVPGGWVVLNAHKYRDLVTRAVAQEKTRERVRAFRARKRAGNADVTVANDSVTQSEAVSETRSEGESALAPVDDFLQERKWLESKGAITRKDGQCIMVDWQAVTKGLKVKQVEHIFQQAVPGIQWPSQFRAARG